MARPRKEKKDKLVQLHFNVSQENALLFETHFKQSGCRSKVQFLLEMIQGYHCIKKKKDYDESIIDELISLHNLFSNIGSNINQIAKQVNTLGYAASQNDIRASLEKVKDILPTLKECANEVLEKTYSISKMK